LNLPRRWPLYLLLALLVLAMTMTATGFHATAKCRDGSYSWSRHHRGTCSSHHGVAQWYR
jgi:hypothetical protein